MAGIRNGGCPGVVVAPLFPDSQAAAKTSGVKVRKRWARFIARPPAARNSKQRARRESLESRAAGQRPDTASAQNS